MEKILLEHNFKNISYDLITWSDNEMVSRPIIEIWLPLNNEILFALSRRIYFKSIEVLNEIPDYFEEFEEPFPKSEIELFTFPEKIVEYMSISSLWSYFIIENLGELMNWSFENAIYHALKCKNIELINSIRYVCFNACFLAPYLSSTQCNARL